MSYYKLKKNKYHYILMHYCPLCVWSGCVLHKSTNLRRFPLSHYRPDKTMCRYFPHCSMIPYQLKNGFVMISKYDKFWHEYIYYIQIIDLFNIEHSYIYITQHYMLINWSIWITSWHSYHTWFKHINWRKHNTWWYNYNKIKNGLVNRHCLY